MRRIILLLLLLSTAMAIQVNVSAPLGEYEHGTIPIKAQLLDDDGDPMTSVDEFRATLNEGGKKTDQQIRLTRDGNYYEGEFEVLEAGEYKTLFTAFWNDSEYSRTKYFDVNTSKMYVEILTPENKTYSGDIEISADVTMGESFVHGATVTAQIGSKKLSMPEGQTHYRATATLAAGTYEMTVTAEKDDQTITAKQWFSVSGEIVTDDNETGYIPGPRLFTLTKVTPDKGEYALGNEVEIGVMAIDNENQKMKDVDVVAQIKTPTGNLTLQLTLKDDILNPKYTATIMLSDNGFYEAYITATKEGYTNATAYFGPFRAGEDLPEMPEDVKCGKAFCIHVTSPDKYQTYSTNDSVSLRVQVIERTAITPISNAAVTVSAAGSTATLDYDWNGYYQYASQYDEGEYTAQFIANYNGETVTSNVTFLVSPHSLVIMPITPQIGENVTTKFTNIQIKLTDESGEIVTGANVRAIIDTPNTGRHTISLDRDVETGYYKSKFTFSGSGTHTVKLVASKMGFVSGEQVYTFEASVPKEDSPIGTQDIIVIALIIGVILIIATLWRALI